MRVLPELQSPHPPLTLATSPKGRGDITKHLATIAMRACLPVACLPTVQLAARFSSYPYAKYETSAAEPVVEKRRLIVNSS